MGALDLGGESFEIAYDPIYHSYSPLGASAIRSQLLRWLQDQSPNAMRVEVACFPIGYEETEFGSDFYGSGDVDLVSVSHLVDAMSTPGGIDAGGSFCLSCISFLVASNGQAVLRHVPSLLRCRLPSLCRA